MSSMLKSQVSPSLFVVEDPEEDFQLWCAPWWSHWNNWCESSSWIFAYLSFICLRVFIVFCSLISSFRPSFFRSGHSADWFSVHSTWDKSVCSWLKLSRRLTANSQNTKSVCSMSRRLSDFYIWGVQGRRREINKAANEVGKSSSPVFINIETQNS